MRARDGLLVLGVALVHLLTFITKPAHIDDTLYLETARGILADPLHPMTNVFHWEMFPRPIYTFAVNPPLYNYQQAMLIKLFGWNLTILHLLSAAYVLLAAAAMMALARRFAPWPAPAMLLLMLAPAVVPGTNLMLDTPALALGLAAVAAWITGIDERSNRWLALSVALATAAVWTKYNSGLMLPPLPLYAALRQRWRAIPWALVPVAGLGLWALHNHLFMPNGTIHLLQSTHRAKEVERVAFLQVLLALVSWGSGFFFLPAFRIRACRPHAWCRSPGDLWSHTPWRMAHYAEHFMFLANGLLLASCIAVSTSGAGSPRAWRDPATRHDLFLLSWPLGVTAFNILFAPHHAPRYYYPAYAAVPLLLIRSLYRAGEPTPGVRRAVWGSVAAQTLVALLLVASDKSFARASRALAERLADARGRSIAYVGHWGFQYYAQQHPRLHPLDVRQPPPPAGSLVAIVGDTFAGEYPAWLQNPNPAAEPGVFETAYSGAEPRSVHFRPVEPRSSTPHPWPLITVGLIDGVQLHASGGQDAWLLPYARRTAPFFLVLVLERIP